MKHVVIAGGGFAGVRLARKLRKQKNLKITVVNDTDSFRYSPALYRAAAGFKAGAAHIPLEWMLLDCQNVTLVQGKVATINPTRKLMTLADATTLEYDYAVCAFGMVTSYFNIEGIADNAFGVKTIDEVRTLRRHIHESLAATTAGKQHYVVIGAGPTGVEVAATIGRYIKAVMKNHGISHPKVEVSLIEAGPRILPQMSEYSGKKAEQELRRLGVKIQTNTHVTQETKLSLKTSSGTIATNNVIWTAGATNNPFYKENAQHFHFNERGKVKVNRRLQTHSNIYVCGDNADTKFSGLAYTAVHHGSFLARDIKARLAGKPRPSHKDPYPMQVVPVGEIAIFQYRGIKIAGKIARGIRRLADLAGYSDVLGPLKALTIWRHTEDADGEDCVRCR
ncbi:FAD-dependent oxidoreductase [Candidatus Saccharibacteria bacterium]|nr:FAD-dependent oxidoreductase [Candidatus Saccharibacteria bacterium]